MKITLSTIDVPLGAILTCKHANAPFGLGKITSLDINETNYNVSSPSLSRHIARTNPSLNLYPTEHRTEIDHWLTFSCGPLSCSKDISSLLNQLNIALAPSTFLTAEALTIADYEVFGVLHKNKEWQRGLLEKSVPCHVLRWYNFIHKKVDKYLASLPAEISATPTVTTGEVKSLNKEDGGKFVELPGAKMGEVVVRFPPEASGYLHIGHAKAALLNQYYQIAFKGKLIMRFDDTNPDKEKANFEKVILEDLDLLNIKPDRFTHTSDYFDLMIEMCMKLLKEGKAFVDDTDPETMKEERDERKESKHRNNSAQKNIEMFNQMIQGTNYGLTCCVRAKIDMKSDNGCLRDPTIYRCKLEPHVKTGNKYKVYPTYDFACPIVDSIEGVTHALRTTEYHDRDDQFYWFIKNLNLRSVHIYEYSRLNMNNTVLSKRKLTWFVNEGLVDGWDDPRFPTVRGIIRKGMTIEGLRDFIIAQGSSRSVVNMEWDKIWAFNKKVLDRDCSRYTALEGRLIPVLVKNAQEECKQGLKHPKDPSKGMKAVWTGPKVLIEEVDADILKVGENATFINWGNILIEKINKEGDKIVSVEAETNLSNTDYKKTQKLTWIPDTLNCPTIPVVVVYFAHLMNKSVLGKDENFKDFVATDTRRETLMIGDNELKTLKSGDIIQLQRKGFFRVDVPYKGVSAASCKEAPIILFAIPDSSNISTKKQVSTLTTKEGKSSAKGKSAEKSPQEEVKNLPMSASSNSSILTLLSSIKSQGDKIRNLKTAKADKAAVMVEVETLKKLKADFQTASGVEWKPDLDATQFSKPSASLAVFSGKKDEDNSILGLHNKIKRHGDKIRKLKNDKADKSVILAEVEILKSLKSAFKTVSDVEWQPEIDISQLSKTESSSSYVTDETAVDIHMKIKSQGDKIRTLKGEKADKTLIGSEVDVLKVLKLDFKSKTGVEWTPEIDMSQFSEKIFEAPCSSETNSAMDIHLKITNQGNKIRNLKQEKADKSVIMSEVTILKSLKDSFKNTTRIEWTPEIDITKFSADKTNGSKVPEKPPTSVSNQIMDIHLKIKTQGDKIRSMKTNKADKNVLTPEIDSLKMLKVEFKTLSGKDWVPEIMETYTYTASTPSYASQGGDKKVLDVNNKIVEQGNTVRALKEQKSDKDEVKKQVDVLLSLKKEFKQLTSIDWKPDMDLNNLASKPTTPSIANQGGDKKVLDVNNKIIEQGNTVRALKEQKSDKDEVKKQVDVLLSLKKEFKQLTSIDWKPNMDLNNLASKPTVVVPSKKVKSVANVIKESSPGLEDSQGKKQTRLGMEVRKEDNFSLWYSQVITKSEMIEYYNVSGCYILRPWSFTIWDFIKDFVDKEIKKLGVENSYFPIFVAKEALEKEKDHIADFSPEVAWVTKSGNSDMAEPVAIRPTSETVMYPSFAKWIQSHRDLPLKLNQWNNIVRWEFKQPTPFLRTREFLWQEGHTAFASKEEAIEEVHCILDIYANVYEDLLAIPVVKGKKTNKEKFAGGDFTTTTEAYIYHSGRAIQGATSHHLGQNFSKMFHIVYDDPKTQEETFVFQNSWGITTRTIGVMVMVHGDNKGLCLPPVVAAIQVVILPVGVTAKTTDEDKEKLLSACQQLSDELKSAGIRTKADLRDNVTPAWKFNHWELKGVPLRIELGPREVSTGQVYVVRRDSGEKQHFNRSNIGSQVSSLLTTVQKDMFSKAKKQLNDHKIQVNQWSDFTSNVEKGNLLLAPFCGIEQCEDDIKKDSAVEESLEPGAPSMGAKSLCIPFEQPGSVKDMKCIHPNCSRKPQFYTLFGRSY